MRKIRNRLLITLVLFGVLSAAAAYAQTGGVSLGKLPSDPYGKNSYQPAPTAGEPDVGQTSPNRAAMSSTGTAGTFKPVMFPARSIPAYVQVLRWTWVSWMARYLNQTP